jgi:hypothetical protein
LKALNTLVFYMALALFLVSCWNRNEFPATMPLEDGIHGEPQQTPVERQPFHVSSNGTDYRVEPRYRYDLRGIVVSYGHHNGNYSLHRLWNDHLNIADICVVWGDNASDVDLDRFDFWNGKFTCNYSTADAAAWKRFREDQISNNHLLADDERLRGKIGDVRVGDQVRVRGWLANYSNADGFSRGTSTSRDDRGNGACETIYVEDFHILQSMDNGWRSLMAVSGFIALGSALLWLVAVMRGVF